MNKIDRLFAAKAVSKEIDKRVKELEAECKDELMEEYLRTGNDRRRSVAFGDKAGYLSVRKSEASAAWDETSFRVLDEDELSDWMDRDRPDTDGFAAAHLPQFALWWFESTGECPPGCATEVIRHEAEPPKACGVTMSVKEDVVIPIMLDQGLLSSPELLMLEGGEYGD